MSGGPLAKPTALDELAGLVVSAWVVLYGVDRLRRGEVELLGVGPVARLALARALAAGEGVPVPPPADGDPDEVDAFVRAVWREAVWRRPVDGPGGDGSDTREASEGQ